MTATQWQDRLDAAIGAAGDGAVLVLTLAVSALGVALLPVTLPAAWLGERLERRQK